MGDRTTTAVEWLTEKVIGCGIAVHRALGPGLLESVYRDCLLIEIKDAQLRVENEHFVGLTYKQHRLAGRLKIDLLVEDNLVVEVKAVERIHPIHLAQAITYLKLSGCPAGLLMNFNATSLRAGLERLTHPDLYSRKLSAWKNS